MLRNGLAQLRDAGWRSVVRLARPNCAKRRFLDVGRRIEVGLTQREVIDRETARLQTLCFRRHRKRGGRGDQIGAFCQFERHGPGSLHKVPTDVNARHEQTPRADLLPDLGLQSITKPARSS